MIHPQDFEQRLGFDKIRERLKSFCVAEPGRRLVDRMSFSINHTDLLTELQQVNEALSLLRNGEMYDTSHFLDDEPLLKIIWLKGTFLEAPDLLALAKVLTVLIQNKSHLESRKESVSALYRLVADVVIDKKIPALLMQVVDEDGTVRSSASRELSVIRKNLNEAHQQLRSTLQRIYRHALQQGWVPEGAQPTIRNGRFAIPVHAANKRLLNGIIQDESATGQTVFIEPAEVVEIANLIRELELAERREVIRLLTELTATLHESLPELTRALQLMAKLDFLQAKARLADELDSCLPAVSDRPALQWFNARHPLLMYTLKGKSNVVPLDITLTESEKALLISGPNAGGKSVCLKTVGLLQYMLQCGLLLPVSPDSHFGIFEDVLIDIGDQQSIENDLSTYSSHLKNMALFISRAKENSLVLIDELGSGTDPNFGGAIAQAILHALLRKRVWCIATTHYYNLKVFAGKTPGIRNGAMRFDETTLKPVYVLDIGKPGSSFAMEIAEKTGIPSEVLGEAKMLAGSELLNFDRLLRQLQTDSAKLQQKLAEAEQTSKLLTEEKTMLQQEIESLEFRKRQMLDEARAEARRLLQEANREIEKTIRHIRENQAQKSETKKVRDNLKQIARRIEEKTDEKGTSGKIPESIRPGDYVQLEGQQGSGEVIETDGKTALVRFGELKTRVDIHRLRKTSRIPAINRLSTESRIPIHEKRLHFNNLLDIRGKRVEEALTMVEQFIDTAILLGQSEVKILHGKGEGILRKAVREKLNTFPQVASVADEHVEQGGAGITVVVLK